jgi:amino acid adenylation domain-containing protein
VIGEPSWLLGAPAPEAPLVCVHEQVRAWARRDPRRVAALDAHATLTYGELLEQAEDLAARLVQRGVGPGSVVPVSVARTVAAAPAFLGVLLAGAAYLPVDPELPAARRAFMERDAGSGVTVTERGPAGTAAGARPAGRRAAGLGDLAYVVHTSGTTGWPKGVAVEHVSLAAVVRETVALFALGPGARILQQTSLSFDPSVLELFLALTTGGTLIHVGRDALLAPAGLERAIREHEAEVLIGTPTVARLLEPSRVPSLRRATFGGEALPGRVARAWAEGGRRVFNVYGPSEGTVFSTAHRCRPDDGPAPAIGRPLPGREVLVVDPELRPVPVGATGEICLGGTGLARGYWNRPELTAERFVTLRIDGVARRFYRTGDAGSVGADGELRFAGRLDRQVKVRGHRVELEEVERALDDLPMVAEAAVQLVDGALVAYVAGVFEPGALRAALAERLPSHMLPRHVIGVDRLPRTTTGKVSVPELPLPSSVSASASASASPSRAPRAETATLALQALLVALYRDVLEQDDVGPDDGLFASGGDSLDAVDIIAAAAQAGVAITPAMLFAEQTPAALAAALCAT